MSTTIMAACWPLQMPPTPKAVLISLADNANDQGHCWPAIATISERTCFSKRAVIDAITWLENAGVVIADRTNGRHTSYQIDPAKFAQPVQEAHRCISRTGAAAAPKPVQLPHQPVQLAPKPVQQLHTNRKNHQEPKAGTATSTKVRSLTFEAWNASLGDQDAIQPEDPIFEWADKAGIPADFMELAWLAFVDRYSGDAKRYADWRAVFRNAVRGNWLKVWYLSQQLGYVLTTIGEQYRRVRDAEQQEAAA
jgi:hypothetical protein